MGKDKEKRGVAFTSEAERLFLVEDLSKGIKSATSDLFDNFSDGYKYSYTQAYNYRYILETKNGYLIRWNIPQGHPDDMNPPPDETGCLYVPDSGVITRGSLGPEYYSTINVNKIISQLAPAKDSTVLQRELGLLQDELIVQVGEEDNQFIHLGYPDNESIECFVKTAKRFPASMHNAAILVGSDKKRHRLSLTQYPEFERVSAKLNELGLLDDTPRMWWGSKLNQILSDSQFILTVQKEVDYAHRDFNSYYTYYVTSYILRSV